VVVLFAEESHTIGPDASRVCFVQRELGVCLVLEREIMLLSEPARADAGGWS
jgi:hypothetical protein